MLPDWLLHKKIGMFGFGVNHAALGAWLVRHGVTDLVVYEDMNTQRAEQAHALGPKVRVETGERAFERATDRDVIFRSPGIHVNHPALEAARARGATVTTQTDLFLELCPARTIGITGTKGKGTTASLLAHLLETRDDRNPSQSPFSQREKNQVSPSLGKERLGEISSKVYLAGNIGTDPFAFLDKLSSDDIVVLELSSGQLQDMTHSPNVAIVLDITPDHLDYHASFDEYVEAKRTIVRYQKPSDIALLNLDSLTGASFAIVASGTVLHFASTQEVQAGGFLVDNTVHFRDPRGADEVRVSLGNFKLLGDHNKVNATAAVTAALLLGVLPNAVEEGLATFMSPPHRLETIAINDGVSWVNDSYASMPQAAAAAVRSFSAPIILIAGGRTKGLSLEPFVTAILSGPVKKVLTIGETGPELQEALRNAGFDDAKLESAETLDRAVNQANEIAKSGDVVLLSPSFTSFDQFTNATHRGETFRKLVQEIGQ